VSEDGKNEEIDIRQFQQFAHLNSDNQVRFLASFCITGRIGEAATMADVDRTSHYRWIANDEEYAKAYEKCRRTISVAVEDSLVEKLIHGWDEPVFQQGAQVGTKRKYDLGAMLRYLEKTRPEIFGNKLEIASNSPEGIPVVAHLKMMRDSVPSSE